MWVSVCTSSPCCRSSSAAPFLLFAHSEHRNWKIKRGLKDFLELIEYPVPKYLGVQQTTQRILYVKKMLARRGDYDALTPTAKGKWTKVLKHNESDVLGMEELVLKALNNYVPN